MPVIANEPTRLSDLLKTTENQLFAAGYMSKELTVASATYTIGQLLGTADGVNYVISDPVAVDGSEVPAAVVVENTDGAVTSVLALVRGPGIVADKAIVLGDHTLADATAALEAFNPPLVVAAQI